MKAVTRLVARYGIVVAFALEIIVFAFLTDDFLTRENQLNVLRQTVAVAVVAAGMTFVILTAGIDLSVGSLVALSGVACAAVLVHLEGPMAVRIVAACVAGVLCGAVAGLGNGLAITKMRIPPFVSTLAMLTIARGLVLHLTQSRSVTGLPEAFGDFSYGYGAVVVMFVLFAASWIVLTRTPFGRHVYAVGGNAEAARLCGIKVQWVLLRVYLISGALAGLSGVWLTSRLNVGDPRTGALMELDAIAAVVVGGTSLMGGRGSIWGTLVGALVIGELNNGLNLLHVEYYSQKIVIGVVLILAAFLDRFRTERS